MKKMLKPLAAIAFVIIVCVFIARTITSSETVADYAMTHKVEPTIEALPEKIDMKDEEEQISVTPAPAVVDKKEDTEKGDAISDQCDSDDNADENNIIQEAFYIEEITDELKEYMRGKSYADNIDENVVNFDMLRHLIVQYNDFNGDTQTGEIVCSELIAQDLLEIFEELYYSGYQFEEISLIDKYDADDDASMDADNTSCFNYRVVDHTTKLSYHAYGLAIDINPFYNPYVQFRNGADYICPTGSVAYADRNADFPYKIDENDLCYKLFIQHGFKWGGAWNSCKDYQHFEKRLR